MITRGWPVLLVLTLSCVRAPVPTREVPRDSAHAPPVQLRVSRVVEGFVPQESDSAIAAFVPAVLPSDSAGSCRVIRTTGSGATTILATFPARDSSATNVSLQFDSAGSLVRFSDTRGARSFRPPPGATRTQFDSARRATQGRRPVTSITVDFASDYAVASNMGDGMPDQAIIGTVRKLESLPKLGPLTERIRSVRKLCGV